MECAECVNIYNFQFLILNSCSISNTDFEQIFTIFSSMQNVTVADGGNTFSVKGFDNSIYIYFHWKVQHIVPLRSFSRPEYWRRINKEASSRRFSVFMNEIEDSVHILCYVRVKLCRIGFHSKANAAEQIQKILSFIRSWAWLHNTSWGLKLTFKLLRPGSSSWTFSNCKTCRDAVSTLTIRMRLSLGNGLSRCGKSWSGIEERTKMTLEVNKHLVANVEPLDQSARRWGHLKHRWEIYITRDA